MHEFRRNNLIKMCIIYLTVNVREGMKYYNDKMAILLELFLKLIFLKCAEYLRNITS